MQKKISLCVKLPHISPYIEKLQKMCYVNNQIVSIIVIMMYTKESVKDTNIAHDTPFPLFLMMISRHSSAFRILNMFFLYILFASLFVILIRLIFSFFSIETAHTPGSFLYLFTVCKL